MANIGHFGLQNPAAGGGSSSGQFQTSGLYFQQSGNSFGMAGNLGTVDANDLNIKAGGTDAIHIKYTNKQIMLGNPASGNAVYGIEMRRPDDGAQQMRGMAMYNTTAQSLGDSVDFVMGSVDTSGNVHADFTLQSLCRNASPTSGRASFTITTPFDAGAITVLQHDGLSGQFYINEQCKMQVDTRFRPSSGNIAEAGYDQIFSRYVASGQGGGYTTPDGIAETGGRAAQLFHMTDQSEIVQLTPRAQGCIVRAGQSSGAVTSGALYFDVNALPGPTNNDNNGIFATGLTSGSLFAIQNSGYYSVHVQNNFRSDTFNTATSLRGAVIAGPNSGLVLNTFISRVVSGMINQAQSQQMYSEALLNQGDIIEFGVAASTGNTLASGSIGSIRRLGP